MVVAVRRGMTAKSPRHPRPLVSPNLKPNEQQTETESVHVDMSHRSLRPLAIATDVNIRLVPFLLLFVLSLIIPTRYSADTGPICAQSTCRGAATDSLVEKWERGVDRSIHAGHNTTKD